MDTPQLASTYANISQRVALSYLRSLTNFESVMPGDLETGRQTELETAERILYDLFRAFYEALYSDPGKFGLPLDEDAAFPDRSMDQKVRQQLNQRFKKIRAQIDTAIDLLRIFGTSGQPAENTLVLPLDDSLKKTMKLLKQFLPGLAALGVHVEQVSGTVVLRIPSREALIPALQSLARAASMREDPKMGRLHFERCDFRALRPGYVPDPLDFYRVYNVAEYAWVMEMHRFFDQLGYKATLEIHDNSAWVVQYQGKRSIKASPLFQVEYYDHYQRQMRIQVKPVSANRLTPLMEQQPQALQADFFKRTNRCNAPQCEWCKNHKGLGPSTLMFQGEKKTVCWYVNSDVPEMTEEAKEIVQLYARLHEALG